MYRWIISFLASLILLGLLTGIGFSYGFFLTKASQYELILGSVILVLLTLLIYEWVYARKELKEKILKETNTKPKED